VGRMTVWAAAKSEDGFRGGKRLRVIKEQQTTVTLRGNPLMLAINQLETTRMCCVSRYDAGRGAWHGCWTWISGIQVLANK